MDYRHDVAVPFANLVALLVRRPSDVAERDDALQQTMAALAGRPALIAPRGILPAVAVAPTTPDAARLQDLVARMSAHSLRDIELLAGADSGEIVAVAAIIAAEAVRGDDGEAFDAKFVPLRTRTVRVTIGSNGFIRGAGSSESPEASDPGLTASLSLPLARQTPGSVGAIAGSRPAPSGVRSPTPVRLTPFIPRGTPARSATPIRAQRAIGSPASAAPRSAEPPVAGRTDTISDLVVALNSAGQGTDGAIFAQLESGGVSAATATRLLFDLANFAEAAALQEDWDTISSILTRIVRGEELAHDPDVKRAYTLAFRRLAKPTLLGAVARQLPRRPGDREQLGKVLLHAGTEAADILIDLLIASDSTTDRRVYISVLSQFRTAVPMLVHLLGDERWYVVRNAADLLGEMHAFESEGRVAELLDHADERVRKAVATALGRFGTPRALRSVERALADASAQVRIGAALGLSAAQSTQATRLLISALDREENADVQLALVAALGRVATRDAVTRLAQLAEPVGLFKKKPARLRLAAVHALAEAGTVEARRALDSLASDRDAEVRQAVAKAGARKRA
jgi:HEAT repeat protein